MPMKCGTTALSQALGKRYRTQRVGPGSSKHPHGVKRYAKYDDCTYVLCVRNPVFRFLSLWQMVKRHRCNIMSYKNKRRKVPPLAKVFISTPKLQDVLEAKAGSAVDIAMGGPWRAAYQLTATKTGKPDYLIKQENLSEDANAFFTSKGHEPLDIPFMRVSARRKPFTESELHLAGEIALRWWHEDFVIGGYHVM